MSLPPSRRALLQTGATALVGIGAPLALAGFAAHQELAFDLPDPQFLPAPVDPPARGVNIHDYDDVVGLDMARAAGFSFVRVDAFWENVEHGGHFDFSAQQGLFERLSARGLGGLIALAYGHSDYQWDDFSRPEQFAGYQRYARELSNALRGHDVAYEVWNEPDVEEKSFLTPAKFAALIAAGAAGVREGNPSALVISGGLSWVDFAYLDPFLAAFAALQPRPRIDVFGMHFYRSDAPETALEDIAAVRARIAPVVGAAMPLWCTEWGYSAGDLPGFGRGGNAHDATHRQRQAAMLARMFLTLWRAGVPRTVWFEISDYQDNAQDPDVNLGLLDAYNREKPTLTAARAFNEISRGRRLTGVYEGFSAGVRGLALDNAENRVVALWSDMFRARARVRLPVTALVEARDMLGAHLPLAAANGAVEIAFTEADGPIYLTLRRG